MGWKFRARLLFPALLLAVALTGCSGEEQGSNAGDAQNMAQAAAQEPAQTSAEVPADEPVAQVAAEIVGTDPSTEIAVLRVDRSDLTAAEFADSDALVPGQLAVALGSPSGFESTVTSGVISGLSREFPPELVAGDADAARSLADLIQTDAAISPGNSGGALADRDGRIMGINVAYLPPAETGAVNIGFAIPADTATSIADQLIETGRVSAAYLGVETGELSPVQAERSGLSVGSGAVVTTVVARGPAAEVGIREGDIITSLGDTPVESYGDLVGALRDYQPGDTAQLTVFRDGEEQTLDVTLDERPQE